MARGEASTEKDGKQWHRCANCCAHLPLGWFKHFSKDICSACRNVVCAACGVEKTSSSFDRCYEDVSGRNICKTCRAGGRMPQAAPNEYYCYECKLPYPVTGFPKKWKVLPSEEGLCAKLTALHANVCSQCESKWKDFGSEAKNRSMFKASREPRKCDACDSLLDYICYDTKDLENTGVLGQRLICKSCRPKGFSPKDVTPYACGGTKIADGPDAHEAGHLAFDANELSQWKRGELRYAQCKKCKTLDGNKKHITVTSACMKRPAKPDTAIMYKCDACFKAAPKSAYNEGVFMNALSLQRKLVCKACQELGFSPKDCARYYCMDGEHYLGHLKFKRRAFNKAKGRKNPHLTCVACEEKGKRLLAKLKCRGSWRCKCPKVIHKADKRRKLSRQHWFYMASAVDHTAPTCPLRPGPDGEKRWEGKNKGITEDDVGFLVRMKRW